MKSDNELIAEFMGARGKIIDGEYRIDYKQEGMKHFWSIPRYHTSWDWLIPVVEKIFMLRHTEMRMGVGSLEIKSMPYKNGGLYFTISVCEPTLTGIQCYHKAVVEFIKWYNENKTTP